MNSRIQTKKTRLATLSILTGFFCLYLFTSQAELPEGNEAMLLGAADRVAHYGFSWLPPGINFTKTFSDYGFYKDGFSKFGLGQSLIDIRFACSSRDRLVCYSKGENPDPQKR